MGVLLTIGCYVLAFSPAVCLFLRFIAKDPLRIILFVLGAFFWLLSLLVSGLVWFALVPFRDTPVISIIMSIIFQEAARVLYFVLLKKAQHGLHKMASTSNGVHVSGVSDLHNARHMLAFVGGLGMGTIAALFLTMNVFASFSGPGTIGLPAALPETARDLTVRLTSANRHLPLYYAISGCALTLLHATWTIQVWDSCHKKSLSLGGLWWIGALLATVTHVIVSGVSFFNESGYQVAVLAVQLIVLIVNIAYCYGILGGTLRKLGNGVKSSFIDWFTLKWIREHFWTANYATQQGFSNVVEVEAEERTPATNSVPS